MISLEDRLLKMLPVVGLAMACNTSQNIVNGNRSTDDTAVVDDTGYDDTALPDDTSVTYEAPVITSSLNETAYVGETFSYTATAEQDVNSGELYCLFTSLDPALILNPAADESCSFTWTPTEEDNEKMYGIAIRVTDNNGSDYATLELTVAAIDENHAPVIETTSLDSAITNTAYNGSIFALDEDGDRLTYSLIENPSWLSINNSSGALSGTPTTSGTSSVEVKVADPDGLYATASYNIVVDPIATLEMYVYNAGGSAIGGDAVEDSCNVEVILTNTSSGNSYTATASSGIASFSLDETGTYDISVPSTNTGSNCYGGVSQSEWLDVSAGINTSWVHVIPEDKQSEVQSVVGSQLDMARSGYPSGYVDSFTNLFQYMVDIDSDTQESYGWNNSIRTGASDLEVEDFNGYTYTGIDYDLALVDAVTWWDDYLAPSISIVNSGSGGDVYFTGTGNWQTDVNWNESGGIWTIADVEIKYGGATNAIDASTLIAHEIGHSFFNHTNVDGFIMHSATNYDTAPGQGPHELELLVAKTLNNVGYESPRGEPINLFSGYTE